MMSVSNGTDTHGARSYAAHMTIKSLQALMVVVALASPMAMSAAGLQAPKPPTADKQSQSKADLLMTQQIRRAVVKDKTLSLAAHNCKIITQQSLVTLRGAVNSDAEIAAVGAIAAGFAGADKVTNMLTVKVKKQ